METTQQAHEARERARQAASIRASVERDSWRAVGMRVEIGECGDGRTFDLFETGRELYPVATVTATSADAAVAQHGGDVVAVERWDG